MTDTKRTVGNLILFGGAVFLSGWVGLLADRLTGQSAPTSLNDYLTGGELPRLVLPLLTVVALRAVAGVGGTQVSPQTSAAPAQHTCCSSSPTPRP